VIFEMW